MTAVMLLVLYGLCNLRINKKNESIFILFLPLHLSILEYSISFTCVQLVMFYWQVMAFLLYCKQFS